MKWYLVGPTHRIVRDVEAAHKAEARFRLAPIPARHFVVSAADFDAGYHPNVLPPEIRRVGRGDWYADCVTPEDFAAVNAKLSHHAVRGLLLWQANNPEKEKARREKIAAYQRLRAERRRHHKAEAARQASIRNGVERCKAKREAR